MKARDRLMASSPTEFRSRLLVADLPITVQTRRRSACLRQGRVPPFRDWAACD
jgi:hypothetical protein